MSRATISTGDFLLDTRAGTKRNGEPQTRENNRPMHMVIIGDFSGRGSRNKNEVSQLARRKPVVVDRDNFEDVFTSFNVSLKLPICENDIAFQEFDDLHPDVLYEHIPLFDDLRSLKRRLNKPEWFDKAAAEITEWSTYSANASIAEQSTPPKQTDIENGVNTDLPDTNNVLDSILSGSQPANTIQGPEGQIEKLIKDIVSPFVETKTDPRLADMLSAVDDATSESMRKIMHNSAFQSLESLWRSVHMLVRRIDTNPTLKLFLFDVSDEELQQDLGRPEDRDSIEASGIFKALISPYQVSGGTPFGILQFDHYIVDSIASLTLAGNMAKLANTGSTLAISGVSERLIGCENIANGEDVNDWQHFPDEAVRHLWQTLREREEAQSLVLAAPRFLLRLPYGPRTSPIDAFKFLELSNNRHPYYLWGNSATLITLLLAESFSQSGWDLRTSQNTDIDELPLHIFEQDGESEAQACAEIYMHDSVAKRFAEEGITVIRSIKNQAAVRVPKIQAITQ